MEVNLCHFFFFFQAEDGIRDLYVTGVQTCALPICRRTSGGAISARARRSAAAHGGGTISNAALWPWTPFVVAADRITWLPQPHTVMVDDHEPRWPSGIWLGERRSATLASEAVNSTGEWNALKSAVSFTSREPIETENGTPLVCRESGTNDR